MKTLQIAYLLIIYLFSACQPQKQLSEDRKSRFDIKKDVLLAHYDCKTDVDDLHSVAALATLLAHPDFKNVAFHAVAGTYGTQEGLYVPPNELFQTAFGDNWSDAHEDFDSAINQVKEFVLPILENSGDIWVAEGGQSDFTAALIKSILIDIPDLPIKERIHVIQHSDWNEEVTDQDALNFVKANTNYHKIPDGNGLNNGTPGFRSLKSIDIKQYISKQELISVWKLAIHLGNKYNGLEDRYLNEAIKAGGLDFSDFSEVCWIFGLENIQDSENFLNAFRVR